MGKAMNEISHKTDLVEIFARVDAKGIATAYKAAIAGVAAEIENLPKVGIDDATIHYLTEKVTARAGELIERFDLGPKVDLCIMPKSGEVSVCGTRTGPESVEIIGSMKHNSMFHTHKS